MKVRARVIPFGLLGWLFVGIGAGLAVLPFLAHGVLVGHAPEQDTRTVTSLTMPPSAVTPFAVTPFAVPFGPGERLEYQVKLGALSVGNGNMSVHGIERVRGRDAYHVSMSIVGGLRFVARVDNEFESWMDVETLASHRFVQDQDELRTKRVRRFEFFPAVGRWEMTAQGGGSDQGELTTAYPLDDISFVYYARALPLEVGQTYTLNQYFRADRNPVILRVVRRDRVTVPAGTFNTIVVQPVIKTRGIFGEGGEAEIHFSDDHRRLLVQMRSRVPLMGSLSLHLRTITPGQLLQPFTAASRLPPGATPATVTGRD